jgi:hypothetical protein
VTTGKGGKLLSDLTAEIGGHHFIQPIKQKDHLVASECLGEEFPGKRQLSGLAPLRGILLNRGGGMMLKVLGIVTDTDVDGKTREQVWMRVENIWGCLRHLGIGQRVGKIT